MKITIALSAFSVSASLPFAKGDSHLIGDQTASGAFWAVYADGGAAPECLADPGTQVDISCCAAVTPQPLMMDASNGTTCFAFAEGIRAFKGCDGSMSLYGEFCAPGEPADVDIGECGCQFQVKGTGCWKANDFPDDPKQFFVYLDDAHDCETEMSPEVSPEMSPETEGHSDHDHKGEGLIGEQTVKGSFWAVYPDGGAAEECLVDPGTPVDISCCSAVTPQPLMGETAMGTTCFSFVPGIRGFKGCSNDMMATYGENCNSGDAANVTIEECGCQFMVQGTGCHKANDFPDDPRQFFVYLDDDECMSKEDMEPESNGETEESESSGCLAQASVSAKVLAMAAIGLLW